MASNNTTASLGDPLFRHYRGGWVHVIANIFISIFYGVIDFLVS
jgi:hypothetical protein